MNKQQENKLYIFCITLVATLGGLLFGYDTAVISGAEKSIANLLSYKQFNSWYYHFQCFDWLYNWRSCLRRFCFKTWTKKVFASSFSIIFPLSALGSGYPEFLFFKEGDTSLGVLIAFNIYRIIGGVGVGLASAISPMYIAEIAPADI